MSKLITFAQLKSCMSTIKAYVNSLVSSVAKSAAEAIEEVANLKADKTDVISKTNTSAYTPSADYHPATKKYVDDTLVDVGTHPQESIVSAEGAHNLRYYNGALQYDDNGTWKTLSISELKI